MTRVLARSFWGRTWLFAVVDRSSCSQSCLGARLGRTDSSMTRTIEPGADTIALCARGPNTITDPQMSVGTG